MQLWAVRHFALYKLPGAAARFAAHDFAALPELCARWSPGWRPAAAELADVRASMADARHLGAVFGYYKVLTVNPPAHLRATITVPTVAFVGSGDPLASPDDFQHAEHMFDAGYVVEVLPGARRRCVCVCVQSAERVCAPAGGHFTHREHPDAFAERLLAHITAAVPLV